MHVSILANFLSRLCGGEVYFPFTKETPIFLSRLCGGEAGVIRKLLIEKFLSRLCGGEEI